ncbi:MAG: ABC transporter substrate-binding protein, partial [Deltaproteobacteria bacterium]|nr:ABC transporter substrate-binding protein [Deltaproteobacteria bacterium]
MNNTQNIYGKPAGQACIYALFLLFLSGALIDPGYWVSKAYAEEAITIGLLEEPKTLNIWRATDTWSNKVLCQLYQPLYIRE